MMFFHRGRAHVLDGCGLRARTAKEALVENSR